jgi:hypothetical protein
MRTDVGAELSLPLPTDASLIRENCWTETFTIRNTTNQVYRLNEFRFHFALPCFCYLLCCFVKLSFLVLTCHRSEKESVVSSQCTRATNVGNMNETYF